MNVYRVLYWTNTGCLPGVYRDENEWMKGKVIPHSMGVYASIKGDELLTTQMNLKSIILHERSHGKPVLYESVFMELAKATVWSARLVVAALRWNSGLTERHAWIHQGNKDGLCVHRIRVSQQHPFVTLVNVHFNFMFFIICKFDIKRKIKYWAALYWHACGITEG